MKFSHLHVHSHYSLLDGLAKIDGILDRCEECGMDSIALTDHGVMYGIVEFYQKAKERGIKPILGMEAYVALKSRHLRRPHIDNDRYHLTLLAKDKKGYQNLIKLTTKAHLEGFYYKPRIDKELLQEYNKGLICLSGCIEGQISRLIVDGKLDKAEEVALEYQEIFGPGNFYLEVMDHPNLPETTPQLIDLSKKTGIPLVATNDSHYIKEEDKKAHDILLCIQTNHSVDEEDRMSMTDGDYSLRPPKQMIDSFKDVALEAIANTQEIVEKCNVELDLDGTRWPPFQVPQGETAEDYLEKLAQEGCQRRFEKITSQIKERLREELDLIKEMGFASYFLIVQDFVNWAKEEDIVVGPGRGCVLPQTKILLADGRAKPIKNINKSDEIISHTGKRRRIERIFDYDIEEEIVELKSKMTCEPLRLTKDHKVLAIKHQMCLVKNIKPTICKPTCGRSCNKRPCLDYELAWVQAKDLTKNDLLVYPKRKLRCIKTVYDLTDYVDEENVRFNKHHVWYEIGTNNLQTNKVKRFVNLDETFARLLGYFISEGWTRTKRGECHIGFAFHKKEQQYQKEVRQLMAEVFGLETTIIHHASRNSVQVFAYSKIVGKFLQSLCGKGAINKRIPKEVFTSTKKVKTTLLTTLFFGDGSRKDTMRIAYDSISSNLVSQIKMLLVPLGIMCSIRKREYKKENWHTSYKLRISGQQLFKFNELFPEFKAKIKDQAFYRNDTFMGQNYVYFPIQKVNLKKYKGKVYDLEVKEESSFVANNVAIHNSAAGSLVSYCLNITDIDPLKYDLLFARFLNRGRIEGGGLPDIDLDFADHRRDEVIDYVREKYGKKNVAQIITFGTMAARAAVRDVGRALGYEYDYCDRAAKLIPMSASLEEALEKTREFRQFYERDPKAEKLIDFAKKMEGLVRHASVHACGVVISDQKLTKIAPLQKAPREEEAIITQYEMHAVEDLGLLKMDFLGLKNLTIIEKTLEKIAQRHNKKIDWSQVPLDDKKTLELFQQGRTTTVFQFESEGMKRYLKQLQPSEFEDIIVMVALYRPGPMELIPEYIARKHGEKEVTYIDPQLEPILEDTYGVPVFQEQIMKIAQTIAGFSLSEADVLRKAIGKKIKKLLDEQRKKFIKGCLENKVSKKIAQQLFSWVEPHARYSFNKSHATSYATIAYRTAYLKAHYRSEFMAAMLTADKDNIDRLAVDIKECQEMGIEVLPPDINESAATFKVVEEGEIRFGLEGVKNVGINIIEEIVKQAPFDSLEDFAERVSLEKKSLEALIQSGALDRFGERGRLLANVARLLEFSRERQKAKQNGQSSLFGNGDMKAGLSLTLKDVEPADKRQYLDWEKELLGLYLSEHPMSQHEEFFNKHAVSCADLGDNSVGQNVKIGGVISRVNKITTKKGEPMAFATLEDRDGDIEAVVFPEVFQRDSALWKEGNLILAQGTLQSRDGDLKLICRSAKKVG